MDEDHDIFRLRADLIKSIREKNSGTSHKYSSTGDLPPPVASTSADGDTDDLEALRLAALKTLQKNKRHVAEKSDYAKSGYNSSRATGAFNHFPRGKSNVGYSIKQTSFLPPSAQRSNLIVIQTQSNSNDEPSVKSSPPKLLLPQDRYSNRHCSPSIEKQKRDDKWSRYEHSSSSSSESSDSEDECEDKDLSRMNSIVQDEYDKQDENGDNVSTGSVLNEISSDTANGNGGDIDEESSCDTDKGSSPEPIETRKVEEPPLMNDSQAILRPIIDDDIFLDEPPMSIEFLDEPIDDTALVNAKFTDNSVGDSESSTSYASKDEAKERIISEMQAVENQLAAIYRAKRHKRRSSSIQMDSSEDSKRNRSSQSPKETPRNDSDEDHEYTVAKKKRKGKRQKVEDNEHEPSDSRRTTLSSVIVTSSRHASRKDESDRKRSRHHQSSKTHSSSDVSHESDHPASSSLSLNFSLPDAGVDLRKFLEKKKAANRNGGRLLTEMKPKERFREHTGPASDDEQRMRSVRVHRKRGSSRRDEANSKKRDIATAHVRPYLSIQSSLSDMSRSSDTWRTSGTKLTEGEMGRNKRGKRSY